MVKIAEIGNFFVTIGSKFDNSGMTKAQKAVVAAIAAFAALAVVIGTKAVKAAIKFEAQMANVATMLDKTSMKMMPRYRSQLLKLSAQYGETTETLAKGLYDILSAGIAASEALDVLEVSAMAAKAGMTETGIAADAITTILNAYGLEAKEAADVSDWLFAIVKRGKTTFAELAPVLGRVASLAATAGLDMDELGAALSTMTKSGIRTEEAVTSLRGVLTAFLKPTKDAKIEAKKLGIELSTNTLKTQGLIPTIEKLSKGTDAQTAKIFGNIRALSGLATILKDTKVFYEDLDFVQNKTGKTLDAFNKIAETTDFKLDQMGQTVNALMVSLGSDLMPVVREGVEVFTKLLGIINDNYRAIKRFSFAFIRAMTGDVNAVADLMKMYDDYAKKVEEDEALITETIIENADIRKEKIILDETESEERKAALLANELTRMAVLKATKEANEKQAEEDEEKIQERRELIARRYATVVTNAMSTVLNMQVVTLRAVADAYKQAVIKMIGYISQQMVAEFVFQKAKAIMNGLTSWGVGAYQIGGVIAAGTAAMAGLNALQNFDQGGIVGGRIGQPQLAIVHGGETVIPNGGGMGGNINIYVNQVHSRREANAQARIIGDAIDRKVRKSRRI